MTSASRAVSACTKCTPSISGSNPSDGSVTHDACRWPSPRPSAPIRSTAAARCPRAGASIGRGAGSPEPAPTPAGDTCRAPNTTPGVWSCDRSVEPEQPEFGDTSMPVAAPGRPTPRPRRSSRPPRNSTSIGRSAGAGVVDRGTDRRHRTELQVACVDADLGECLDTVRVDVEREQPTAARIDGQVEPRRAGLFGAHADAGGRCPLQIGASDVSRARRTRVARRPDRSSRRPSGRLPSSTSSAARPVSAAASAIQPAMSRMKPLPSGATNTRTGACGASAGAGTEAIIRDASTMRTALRGARANLRTPRRNTPTLSGWCRTSCSIWRTRAWRLIDVGSASAMARTSARRSSASARS